MFLYVLVAALAYFIYKFASDLWLFEGEWQMAQYGELIMLIISIPVFIFSVIRAIKQYKVTKVEREEQTVKQQKELDERSRRLFLDDDEEAFNPVILPEQDDHPDGEDTPDDDERLNTLPEDDDDVDDNSSWYTEG